MTDSVLKVRGDTAWDEPSLVQLRDDLKLTPGQRLAIAEALLAFAIRTPNYTPKANPLPRF